MRIKRVLISTFLVFSIMAGQAFRADFGYSSSVPEDGGGDPGYEDGGGGGHGGGGGNPPITNSPSQSISITINNVNRAPVVGNVGDQTLNVGQTITVFITITDPDGDAISAVTEIPDLPFVTITPSGGNTYGIDIVPVAGQEGTYSNIKIRATDNGSPSPANGESQPFTITVNAPVNTAPVLPTLTDPVYVDEGNGLVVGVGATDAQCPDGSCLTYSFSSVPSTSSFCSLVQRPVGMQLECAPGYDKAGSYLMTVNVADNGTPPLSDSGSYTMIVRNVNRAPVANSNTYTKNEDESLVDPAPGVLGNDTDPDGDALTLTGCSTVPANQGNLICDPSGSGSFAFIPAADFNGPVTFTYTISDGQTPPLTANGNVTINVAAVNDAPRITTVVNPPNIPNQTLDEGQVVDIGLRIQDIEGNNINVASVMPRYVNGNAAPGFISITGCSSGSDITCTLHIAPGSADSGMYTDLLVRAADTAAPPLTGYSNIFSVNVSDNMYCGNSIVEPPEQCDDGNTVNGDGCSNICTSEKVRVYNATIGGTLVASYPTIQSAINNSTTISGYRVEVDPGTYVENIDFKGKNIRVHGMNNALPELTVIDGNGTATNDTVVKFVTGEGPGAVLEGFAIQNGKSTVATKGGGVTITGTASPTIKFCVIKSNTTTSGQSGGGIHVQDTAAPLITDTTIINNTALNGGGMMLRAGTNATITNCNFTSNSLNAGGTGGAGIFSFARFSITNSIISYNIASASGLDGGGIYLSGSNNSLSTLDRLYITNNVASASAGDGGGIYSYFASPTITNSFFANNTAAVGGAIRVLEAHPLTVSNSVLVKNSANSGGAFYHNNSEAAFINSTIADNSHSSSTSGTLHYGNGSLTVTNSIIWNDEIYQIWQSGGTTYPAVSYSDLKLQSPAITGTAIKNVDPVFLDPPNNYYQLSASSPAAIIDAGDGNVDPTTDYGGLPRYDDPGVSNTGIGSPAYVDMGASERQAASLVQPIPGLSYCSGVQSCPMANPGVVRVYNASNVQVGGVYSSIQLAIDAALNGYTVKVWPGTYVENLRINGKRINLIGVNGRDATIIAGCNRPNANENPAIKVSGSSSDNTLIDGFTFRNGSNTDDDGQGEGGGGIYIDAASVTVQNVIVRDNYAIYGAGISAGAGDSVVTVRNAVVTGNVAAKGGGGISVYSENIAFNLENSEISNNCSDSDVSDEPHHSGGFYLASRDNDGSNDTYATVNISDTLIHNNTDYDARGAEGGGIYDHDDDNVLTLTNVTVVNNHLAGSNYSGAAGGMDFGYPDFSGSNRNKLNVRNSIFWNNDAYEFSSLNPIQVGNIVFDYTAVQNVNTEAPPGLGSLPHVGNISPADIMFVSAAGNNYRLRSGSPAINAGDPSASLNDPDGSRSDMGAFPYWEETVTPPPDPKMNQFN